MLKIAKHNASTGKTYLHYVKSYFDYLCRFEAFAPAVTINVNSAFSRWSRVIRRLFRQSESCLAKPQLDLSRLKAMLSSPTVVRGDELLAEKKNLTPLESVRVRDSLLIKSLLSNCCRNGVLSQLTVTEFTKAELIGSKYVVEVKSHKTRHCFGPAKLVLSPKLYNEYALYLKYRSPPKTETDRFFLNKSQLPTSTCSINYCLKRTYDPSLKMMIKTTYLRSQSVTYVHKHKTVADREIHARKLLHAVSTAEHTYKNITSAEDAVLGSQLVMESLGLDSSDI